LERRLERLLAGGQEARIGFVHNFLEYAPQYPDGWSSYYIQPICSTMQTIWANQVLSFLHLSSHCIQAIRSTMQTNQVHRLVATDSYLFSSHFTTTSQCAAPCRPSGLILRHSFPFQFIQPICSTMQTIWANQVATLLEIFLLGILLEFHLTINVVGIYSLICLVSSCEQFYLFQRQRISILRLPQTGAHLLCSISRN